MTSSGFLIPEADQEYVFMPPFLTGMTIPIADNLLKEYMRCSPLKVESPLPFFDWMEFVQECKDFLGPNFYQFVMFLAGGISAFHYQQVLKIVGKNVIKRILTFPIVLKP